MRESHLLDTDMLLHCRIGDQSLRAAAEHFLGERQPLAVCEFSMVEFKSSYIQSLQLLGSKILDSDSVEEAVYRITYSSDRTRTRMLMILAQHLAIDLRAPWAEIQGQLITAIDGQIAVAWADLETAFEITRDFECSRAEEPPRASANGWNVVIPKCKPKNTDCSIVKFFLERQKVLRRVLDRLQDLPDRQQTKELDRIAVAIEATLEEGSYPWKGTTCRSVGDLLIALQSASHRGLLTSNRKEHLPLSDGVGNTVHVFPVTEHRLKRE
ncbi:MAG: hypothetical protein GY719_36795 [bacterium]|nr:hypothetical protein [bacterium]